MHMPDALTLELDRLVEVEECLLDAAEARALVGRILELAVPERMGHVAMELHAALRSWTGRALRGTLPAEDLREWQNLIGAIGAKLGRTSPELGHRTDVLKQLVHERVAIAESRTEEDVLQKQHAREFLTLLGEAAGRTMARTAVLDALGLRQANLSRVINLLVDAGCITRHRQGRNATFELTARGADLLGRSRVVRTRRTAMPAAMPEPMAPDEMAPMTLPVAQSRSRAFRRFAARTRPMPEPRLAAA